MLGGDFGVLLQVSLFSGLFGVVSRVLSRGVLMGEALTQGLIHYLNFESPFKESIN